MKQVKKWLLPALTCLLAAGAVLLPPYLSQARDDRQFGQVHTELLEAGPLPAQEAPTLLDRLELYVRWRDLRETIPSFRSPEEASAGLAEELIRAGLERLVEGDVFPFPAQTLWTEKYLPDLSVTSWSYVLLWDPEQGVAQQEPYTLWELSAEMGTGSVWMALDTESGLPLYFDLYDSDTIQWVFPQEDPEALTATAERFLALLGLEGERFVLSTLDSGIGQCIYHIKDTGLYYRFDYTENQLIVRPEPEKWLDDYITAFSGSDHYDSDSHDS